MERRRAQDVEWADAPSENFTGRVRLPRTVYGVA